MKLRKPYRQAKVFDLGFLQVSPTHKIYYEQSGNRNGKSVLRPHGGPGGKSKPKHRKIFDPKKWRIITYDQRGCGKSTPEGLVKENTTQELVNDIEKLRKHLEIDRWTIYGSSWGSTLAVLFAEEYPKTVRALILSSIFLTRKQDYERLFVGNDLKRLFPDLWEWRQSTLKEAGVGINNPNPKLLSMLSSKDKKRQKTAAMILENWEGQLSDVNKIPKLTGTKDVEDSDIFGAKIMMHYSKNKFFLSPNQLIANAHKLPKVPTVILHGRYDVVCPLEQAWELHKTIPHSKLVVVPGAGHSVSNSEKYTNEVIKWTDRFAK